MNLRGLERQTARSGPGALRAMALAASALAAVSHGGLLRAEPNGAVGTIGHKVRTDEKMNDALAKQPPANRADAATTLWYTGPATDWMTQALPIGNGSLGGMVFGAVGAERIQFNENTLWTGDEADTGAYQNFGELRVSFGTGGALVAPGRAHNDSTAAETIAASHDGDPATKWCVIHEGQEVLWVKEFRGDRQALRSYAFTSANDVPERDPRTWVLEGSQDGKDWRLLDKHESEAPFPERHLRKTYAFVNGTAYRFYRFRFQPAPDCTHFQVAEIELGNADAKEDDVTDYRRELDLSTAIHRVCYAREGILYQREAFCSHPDRALVIRFTASRPGSYTGHVELTEAHGAIPVAQGDELTAAGALSNGLKYEARVKLLCEGGEVEATNGVLEFRGADALTVLLTAGTDYLNRSDRGWRGDDPHAKVTQTLASAASKSFEALKAAHVADYRSLFDCFSAQLKAPAEARQLCHAHQLRDLQFAIDAERSEFAYRMQRLLLRAQGLAKRQADLSAELFADEVAQIEAACDALLSTPASGRHGRRLQKRYRKHREALFAFLYRADVSPDNNACERALRKSVVHRKVSGGFRSEWGAAAFATMATVIETAAKRGEHALCVLTSLLTPGAPLVPLPQPP